MSESNNEPQGIIDGQTGKARGSPMKFDLDKPVVVTMQPGDVLVISTQQRLPWSLMEGFRVEMRKAFPDHELVILEPGMSLDTYRPVLTKGAIPTTMQDIEQIRIGR